MLVREQAVLDAADVSANYGSTAFPVDAENVAQSMGMQVFQLWLPEDVSGMLEVRPDEAPRIYVDSRDVVQRQRFTIAHEIGHYVERTTRARAEDVLHFNFIDRRGAGYDLHEFYADEFAANLLMPAQAILNGRAEGTRLVGLARHFGVSLQAMRKRLQRLDLEPR